MRLWLTFNYPWLPGRGGQRKAEAWEGGGSWGARGQCQPNWPLQDPQPEGQRYTCQHHLVCTQLFSFIPYHSLLFFAHFLVHKDCYSLDKAIWNYCPPCATKFSWVSPILLSSKCQSHVNSFSSQNRKPDIELWEPKYVPFIHTNSRMLMNRKFSFCIYSTPSLFIYSLLLL